MCNQNTRYKLDKNINKRKWVFLKGLLQKCTWEKDTQKKAHLLKNIFIHYSNQNKL